MKFILTLLISTLFSEVPKDEYKSKRAELNELMQNPGYTQINKGVFININSKI
jgi:hypothetical protein